MNVRIEIECIYDSTLDSHRKVPLILDASSRDRIVSARMCDSQRVIRFNPDDLIKALAILAKFQGEV